MIAGRFMKEEDSLFYSMWHVWVCTKQWNVLERVKMKLREKMRFLDTRQADTRAGNTLAFA